MINAADPIELLEWDFHQTQPTLQAILDRVKIVEVHDDGSPPTDVTGSFDLEYHVRRGSHTNPFEHVDSPAVNWHGVVTDRIIITGNFEAEKTYKVIGKELGHANTLAYRMPLTLSASNMIECEKEELDVVPSLTCSADGTSLLSATVTGGKSGESHTLVHETNI